MTLAIVTVRITTMKREVSTAPPVYSPTRTTDEWASELGRAVRLLRVNQRMTQEDLAKSANIALTALRNLEAGRGSSLRSFILVLRVLGQTDWLSALTPKEPSVSPMELLRQRENAKTPVSRVRVRNSRR